MLRAIVPATLEDVDEAYEVAVDVGVRVLKRVSDPCLGGKVDDRLGTFGLEDACGPWAVRQVHPDEAKAGFGSETSQPGFLQADVLVVIRIAEAKDLVAAIHEAVGQV
jgi:hypothetical protein